MISSDKFNNALYALQATLIRARAMSADENTSNELFKLLDEIEYLPRLIASPEDETDLFRSVIAHIAERHACWFALQRFDAPVPDVW